MIAEAAIAGVTVCFVACLRFTRYVIEREDKLDPNPFVEKRRILERDRAEWMNTKRNESTQRVKEIDDRLIALADEEAAR